jgi:hypothetical protein
MFLHFHQCIGLGFILIKRNIKYNTVEIQANFYVLCNGLGFISIKRNSKYKTVEIQTNFCVSVPWLLVIVLKNLRIRCNGMALLHSGSCNKDHHTNRNQQLYALYSINAETTAQIVLCLLDNFILDVRSSSCKHLTRLTGFCGKIFIASTTSDSRT